jgi:hypothetical protein
MHSLLLVPLLLAKIDCTTAEPSGPMLPLSLNLPNNQGQAYLSVPLTAPGMACEDPPRPPADVLRGEPGTCYVDLAGQPCASSRCASALFCEATGICLARYPYGSNCCRGCLMRLLSVLLTLLIGGCVSFSSSNPPPPSHTTVVVPPGTTAVCPDGSAPPC